MGRWSRGVSGLLHIAVMLTVFVEADEKRFAFLVVAWAHGYATRADGGPLIVFVQSAIAILDQFAAVVADVFHWLAIGANKAWIPRVVTGIAKICLRADSHFVVLSRSPSWRQTIVYGKRRQVRADNFRSDP